MHIAQLTQHHDEIERIADELAAAINYVEARPIAGLRWRLARSLIAHLALEDQWLYPALISSNRKDVADIAVAFQDEMGDLATIFRAYMAEWTDLRIAREWSDFCAVTRDILDMLRVRILHENQTLYPAAQKMLGLTQLLSVDTSSSPADTGDTRTAV